jgi:hypothetical protein
MTRAQRRHIDTLRRLLKRARAIGDRVAVIGLERRMDA